jgi:NAD(P)-dependent dehydrogenase (short-subunit alcohol dehydrogenase family)
MRTQTPFFANNPVIIVAGAAGGIGRAVCEALAARGARIVAAGRGQALLELSQLGKSRGWEMIAVEARLDESDGSDRCVRAALEQYGRLDGYVHCAGRLIGGEMPDLSEEQVSRTISDNLLSVALGIHSVVPAMEQTGGGRIVIVGSLGGIVPMPHCAIYSAAKAGVRALCTAMREEIRSRNIIVSHIAPGGVDTNMLLEDARHEASSLAFFTKTLAPAPVAATVIRALVRGGAEYILPRWLITAPLIGGIPLLFALCYPIAARIGAWRRAAYLTRVPRLASHGDLQ